jgi:hypothetical protein
MFGKILLAFLLSTSVWAQQLSISPSPSEAHLKWSRTFPENLGVASRIHSRILSSTNLINWVQEDFLTFEEALGNGESSFIAPLNGPARFYRLEEFYSYVHRDAPSAAPTLYNQQFLNSSSLSEQKPPLESDDSASDPACLDSIPWDPTTASFFAAYNTSLEDHNAALPPNDPERRVTDFSLNEN